MANGDFVSKHTGEEIERILDGSVVFNEYQKLSEVQKAQARRNIGAGTVDSGLVIKGYYTTYEELIAAQTNPHVSDAYGVGVAAPYDIYVWDSVNKLWVNNGTITKGERGERGEDGKDGESPTKENITSALGYTPAAANLSNVSDGSVVTKKLADSAVTRTKLAPDALYSPLVSINSNSTPEYIISPNDTGKTIRESARSAPGLTVSFTNDVSSNLPIGAEFAVLDYSKNSRTKLKFVNCNVIVAGHDSFYGSGTTTTIFEIADCFTLVAVKKIAVNSGISLFLLTGNVEVAT